jgi:CRISPR-associated protein Csd2
MNTQNYLDPHQRHDFVYLFDVTCGNPNGDPDNGGLPRIDPETMDGLVSDVCIKRKIRNWVDVVYGTQDRYKIYVQDKGIALNELHDRAYTALKITSTGSRQKAEEVEHVRAWMCENFFDIRMLGAVMTTGTNCGQVHGPFQVTFAESLDAIRPLDLAITRVAITQPGTDKVTMMGRKAIVPYALYRGYGYYSPSYARKMGVTAEDMQVFWQAFSLMWDLDRSAARGTLTLRGLHVFSHENPLGCARAETLLQRVMAKRNDNVEIPQRLSDYTIAIDQSPLPHGVTYNDLLTVDFYADLPTKIQAVG